MRFRACFAATAPANGLTVAAKKCGDHTSLASEGSPALASCPANRKQRLRFVAPSGEDLPAKGARVFVACDSSGKAL